MKYALINGERQEAQPGLIGKCQCCDSPVTAKCGAVRMHHWAHTAERECDPWWEETEWHRAWKGQFPKEWHERVHHAENGEKHIADVKTSQNYVIEFQHSPLDSQEQAARESFYQNMIWVVDGTRLKRDYPRFLEGSKNFRPVYNPGFFLAPFPEECFPAAWLNSSVEVIFDFQGILPIDPHDEMRNTLYCLLPGRTKKGAIVIAISRQVFMTRMMSESRLLPDSAHEVVKALDKLLIKQEEVSEQRTRAWQPPRPRRAIIRRQRKRF